VFIEVFSINTNAFTTHLQIKNALNNYEHAADNYGLITSAQAKELGIPNIELVKLSHRGRLLRVWQSVYRIPQYVPTPLDKYAEAVAIVGNEAFVYGESVLAMHGLAFVNPAILFIGIQKRIRKNLPMYIKAVKVNNDIQMEYHEGIPSQSIVSSIITCSKLIMNDRLLNAVEVAAEQGLITDNERTYLKEVLFA
jgi:predicted transcriptional regulator of viral defense system